MAGAMIGGWFGQSIVDQLVSTVVSYLQDQIQWKENIQKALRNLHAVLLPIQATLRDAEKVEMDADQTPELVSIVWQLRDAVEEADDVIDEMEYFRIERQVMERDAAIAVDTATSDEGKGMKVLCCFPASNKLFKHKLVKIGKKALKLDDTLEKLNAVVDNLESVNKNIHVLDDFVKRCTLLGGNLVGMQIHGKNKTPETGHELTVDELIGRDKDKKRVLKWLVEADGNVRGNSDLSALTIWGLGGVGKTTLAQAIYNDDMHIKDYFQVKMWVCVSNNHIDMMDIMKKAIESTTKVPPKAIIMTSLQEEVKTIVSSNRCLLVLDDVWEDQNNQSPQEWQKFIGLILKHASNGSKILITSRTQSIADNILRLLSVKKEEFQLGCLLEKESFSLFNKRAFYGVNPDTYMQLQSVGKKIAKKCGGLPLALNIIGGLLNEKLDDVSYWDSISEKSFSNLEKGKIDVMEVLKFSYRCLPSYLQSCFRICSLFPHDYMFEKDKLIEMWIGTGCIQQGKDENKFLEDIGQDYLKILVKRSFLLVKRSIFFSEEETFFTIHDLLHDLAREVSVGECMRIEKNRIPDILPKTLRHLFIGQLNNDLLNKMSSLQKLRTLIIDHDKMIDSANPSIDSYHELNDILINLKSLRALFLNVTFMPDLSVVGNLIHLRFFHMSVDYAWNKPLKSLYKLYHLQNLKIKDNSEKYTSDLSHNAGSEIELDGIKNLMKLWYLDLPNPVFKRMTQLQYLTNLQKLELQLSEDSALKLSDLKNLNMLRHLIIIDNLEVFTTIEEAEAANLCKKEHLESLSLKLNNPDPQLHEQVSNCLQLRSHSNVKKLNVLNFKGTSPPRWMTSSHLPYVTNIELHNCDNLKHFPSLSELPSLKILSLKNIPCVTECFSGVGDIRGFPSLEKLEIVHLNSWKEWSGTDNTSWFPHLKHLYINGCKNLKELPALPLSLKRLKLNSVGLISLPSWQDNEVSMYGKNVPVIEELSISACEELVSCHPFLIKCVFLRKLRILGCPKLLCIYYDNNVNQAMTSSVPLNLLDELQSLSELELNGFPNLTTLPSAEAFSKMTSLKEIRIEYCANLTSLGGLYMLTSLTYLRIKECRKLVVSSLSSSSSSSSTPSALDGKQAPSEHSHLQSIEIDDVLLLQLEPLRSTKSVQNLKLEYDKQTTSLPLEWIIQNRNSIEILHFMGLRSLPSIPDEVMISSLTELRISNLPLLKCLPALPASLTTLWIINLPLFVPSSFPKMPLSLTTLWIDNLPLLKGLPALPPSLTYLRIHNLPLLESLENLPSSLTTLKVSALPLLKSLPDILPASLPSLYISNCPELQSLPDIIGNKLETLYITACPLLKTRYEKYVGSDWKKIHHQVQRVNIC